MASLNLDSITDALHKAYGKERIEAIVANTMPVGTWNIRQQGVPVDDLATAVMQRDAMIAKLRDVLKTITEVKGDNRGQQCKRIAEKALKGKKIW